MSQKIIIVVGVVVLAILALFMFNGPDNQSVSPNVLYITQPVNSFSGKVEKVAGNVILVSSQYSLPQTAPIVITVMPGQPPIIPTPQTKTISYTIRVGKNTQINQAKNSIPYLIKQVSPSLPSPEKITIDKVKVGQIITVNSAVDLRTLKSNEFEATMISLPQFTNILSGRIVSVTNNTLTLKAFAPMAAGIGAAGAGNEKVFTVTVNQNTEISRMIYNTGTTPGESPTPPKPEKLTIGDLKKDMQANVYTVEDATESQSLTALRIEPLQTAADIINPPAIPSPSASASPSIKP
jgi:hypothetical protein